MCELYYPSTNDAAPLDDFQIFKKKWTLPYGNYYSSSSYDSYEPEIDSASNVYHDLVNAKEYPLKDDYKNKYVVQWTEEDTLNWFLDIIQCYKISEYDMPYYIFRIPGVALRGMKREDIVQLILHNSIDQNVSRRIADIIYQNLQQRLNDEHAREAVPVSVLRYVEGDSYQNPDQQTVLDLDNIPQTNHKDRLYANDYRHHDDNTYLPSACDSSDEELHRLSETASPDASCSSDSKSSDEDEKKREFKRPPGRPKGSGRKISKRVKSVSVPVFLRNLLLNPEHCPSIIKWEDYSQGKFR